MKKIKKIVIAIWTFIIGIFLRTIPVLSYSFYGGNVDFEAIKNISNEKEKVGIAKFIENFSQFISQIVSILLPIILFVLGLVVILNKKISKKVKIIVAIEIVVIIGLILIFTLK